jgi:hypothetical protein
MTYTSLSCSGDCPTLACEQARIAVENSGDRNINWRNYSSAEQMACPEACVHCGNETIDMVEFKIMRDGNKIRWIQDYQCDNSPCYEFQFTEITEFICPNLPEDN